MPFKKEMNINTLYLVKDTLDKVLFSEKMLFIHKSKYT